MTRKEEQVRKAMLHYLEGSIHPEELEVLNQVVETDPEARRDLAELMLQDALLTKVSQESEFFELDEARPVPPAAISCRTTRIMKVTRRSHADLPAATTSYRRVAMAAAAILFTVSVAMAVRVLQPAGPESQPVTTTVMPIVPAAPAEAAPVSPEPASETPAKAVVQTPAAPQAKPVAKPVAKPKTSTARKDTPEPKPTTTVPEGFLTLPSSNKLPPPSPSKPAPKLPPKQPPQKK